MKIIIGILGMCVVMPLWYFLLYRILIAIQATELTWFLFWVYIPVTLLVQILVKVSEE